MAFSQTSQMWPCAGSQSDATLGLVVKKLFVCLILAALAALLILRFRPEAEVLPSLQPYPELSALFEKARTTPDLASAVIGFCLLNDAGEVLFEQNSHTAFVPASTLKTVTTATALEKWGPDFRIETTLLSTAPIQAGIIQGDVVIKGGGDPMLSLQDLQEWVEALQKAGLKQITGRIIGDGRLFKESIYDDFWDWGDIGNGYGSGVSGLNLEHNRYTASFQPAAQEGTLSTFVGASPVVPEVQWMNEVSTGPAGSGDGVMIHGGEHTHTLHLRGTIPMNGGEFQVEGAVPDPELYAAFHLRTLLIEAGITVDGAAEAAYGKKVPEAKEHLHTHQSPPLIEIINSIHATSDNHETECLYRLLGILENRTSAEVVREHWENRELTFKGLRMEDGCGLARADFIRPLDLTKLQHLANTGPHGELYRESLIPSQDGLLRWKPGGMSGIRCYTGLAQSRSGKKFSFTIMMNHFRDSSAASALWAQLQEVLVGL